MLGSLTALSFICIDFYYALNDTISDIYLLDGVLEILFFISWICIRAVVIKESHGPRHKVSMPGSTLAILHIPN